MTPSVPFLTVLAIPDAIDNMILADELTDVTLGRFPGYAKTVGGLLGILSCKFSPEGIKEHFLC